MAKFPRPGPCPIGDTLSRCATRTKRPRRLRQGVWRTPRIIVLGFEVLGFEVLGFEVLGFEVKVLGFEVRGFEVLGF